MNHWIFLWCSRRGIYCSVILQTPFLFFFLQELCSCHDCKQWRSAWRKQKWNTERASLDFPSNSVHRQSQFCDAAPLTDGAFWSKKLVDQDHSRTCVCLLADTTIPSLPSTHSSTLGLARHVEMTATCFLLSGCFSSSISSSCLFPWVGFRVKHCRFHFFFFLQTHQTSLLPLTHFRSPALTSHCAAVTYKPLWQLHFKCVRSKKTKQVYLRLWPLFISPGSRVVSLWRRYRLQKFRWLWGEAEKAQCWWRSETIMSKLHFLSPRGIFFFFC